MNEGQAFRAGLFLLIFVVVIGILIFAVLPHHQQEADVSAGEVQETLEGIEKASLAFSQMYFLFALVPILGSLALMLLLG